jgi:deoxyribonuclease IV
MPRPRPKDLIGCHVSTAGGLHEAPARADAMGASSMQLFTANQRQWKAPVVTDALATRFREALAASHVALVMSHASYLVNLASPNGDVRAKSLATFVEELRRCTKLGIPLLNFHPGAHLGSGEETGIRLVADAMCAALDAVPHGPTRLLVELTAGQGSSIGHRLEQVAAILARVKAPERTGICIDTAHVYAAGYDIKAPEGYEAFFRGVAATVGLQAVSAVHVNDSKTALGSHVDRHEQLGQGTLGRAFFRRLVQDRRLRAVPLVLETPDEEQYPTEITLLRKLRASAGPPAASRQPTVPARRRTPQKGPPC